MEQYFRAIGTSSEEDKVYMASIYLAGDAKLWWHSKFNGRACSIKTWGELKKELMDAFFPENVEYVALKKLRELHRTTSVRDYVRDFVALMLDIKDMSENDKIFYFLEGLQQ
ncbi:hypothetical protein HRI_002325800 [Hibiscus trionum]|uniref:Retrotransposon gag domain-containing protein n=1 Tax=Hibiscus trionum TaxID=183268 RepID=A0A9W7HY25_HIBTR|nr:hypothetical protein HRI_002325800 [Hibiscus trionum]